MKINDLLKRRSTLEAELSAKRAGIVEAERAINLCAKAEKAIPELVRNLASAELIPRLSTYAAPDDRLSNRKDFSRALEQIGALERLQSDMKDIAAHWRARLAKLTA